MIEALSVSKLVNNLLSTDAQLISLFSGTVPVYNESAPHDTGIGPYIVFNVPGGKDSNTLDGNRILVPGDVNISVCAQDIGYGAIKPMADRIDVIMRAQTQLIVDGVFITKFVRQTAIMFTDDTNDIYWYYLGGMYTADIFEYGQP